jgi:hypothetical protein
MTLRFHPRLGNDRTIAMHERHSSIADFLKEFKAMVRNRYADR